MGTQSNSITNFAMSEIKAFSASADQIETSANTSLNDTFLYHYAPALTGSNRKFSSANSINHRYLIVQAQNCTVTISYPTSGAVGAWLWKSADGTGYANSPNQKLNITHTDHETNGRSLYLRATSYLAYTHIALTVTPDYGCSMNSYAFYTDAARTSFVTAVSTSSTSLSLYSGTHWELNKRCLKFFCS
jgi:hypothetical protein